LKRSQSDVAGLAEKYDDWFEKLYKRMGKHENRVTELSSEHEQSKAFKKQRIETIEKEQKKLHELVHGQIWVKVKALEGGNKDLMAPISQKIVALEQEIELLRGPIMTEGRNLIAENQTMQREIHRM
jgi:hypothetical protein